jgi:hypothetical protein
MDRNRTIDRTDYDALRGHVAAGRRADGRVEAPLAEEPSQRRNAPGKGGVRVLDRIVLGAAYAVQWLRSRWTSRHEGRS